MKMIYFLIIITASIQDSLTQIDCPKNHPVSLRGCKKVTDDDLKEWVPKERHVLLINSTVTCLPYEFFTNVEVLQIEYGQHSTSLTCSPLFVGILSLTIYGGIITNLSFTPFQNLRELEIIGHNLSSLNEKTFFGLNDLRKLRLVKAQIKELKFEFFSSLCNLREIKILENSIKNVDLRIFEKFIRLSSLSLKSNGIENTEFHYFGPLEKLDISGNNLKNATFYVPPTLEVVDKFKIIELFINGKCTKPVEKVLKCVNVSDEDFNNSNFPASEVNCIPDKLLWKIDKLEIYGGVLSSLTCTLNVNNVRNLIIKNTKFKRIDFNPFKNLETLSIQNVNLNNADINIFCSLNEMTSLELDNVYITKIEFKIFCNSSKLEKIKIVDNNIPEVDLRVFQNLSKLRDLDLSGNKIRTNVFTNWNNLTTLDLRNNKFKNAKLYGRDVSELLGNIKCDICKFLGRNVLKCITGVDPKLVDPNISLLILENVSLKCINIPGNIEKLLIMNGTYSKLSCQYNNVKELDIISAKVESIDLSPFSNVTKLYIGYLNLSNPNSNTFRGLEKMTEIDLHYVEITNLSNGIFSELLELRTIRIIGNNIKHVSLSIFENLKNLRTLVLRENNIQTTEFYNRNNLSTLDLSYNNFENAILYGINVIELIGNIKYGGPELVEIENLNNLGHDRTKDAYNF